MYSLVGDGGVKIDETFFMGARVVKKGPGMSVAGASEGCFTSTYLCEICSEL